MTDFALYVLRSDGRALLLTEAEPAALAVILAKTIYPPRTTVPLR
jgi:hypothetical protein